MPLQAHVLNAPAGCPIDEQTRAELIDFGSKNLSCLNVRQHGVGDVDPRHGFTAMTTTRTDGTSPTVGYKTFADGNTLMRIVDGPTLEAYSAVGDRWKSLGRLPECTDRLIGTPTIPLGSTYGVLTDLCYCNGYFVTAWSAVGASGGFPLVTAVTNATTNAVVRPPEVLNAGTSTSYTALLATYGVYVIAIWGSTATISAYYLDTTSAASVEAGWVAFASNIATDGFSGVPFVAPTYAVQSLNDRVAVLYCNNSVGTSRVTCLTINISGLIQAQPYNTASVLPAAVALCGSSSDTLWCAWNEGTSISVIGLTPNLIGTPLASKASGVMTMVTGCSAIGIAQGSVAGTARVIANDTNAATQLRMRSIVTTAGAAVASGAEVRVAASFQQRPWQYAGRYYVTAVMDYTQNTATVVDWSDSNTWLRPVAQFAPGLVSLGGPSGRDHQRTAVVGATASKVYLVVQITRSGAADATQLLELDYANPERWKTAYFGNSTMISGGIVSCFDGVRVGEASMLHRPATPTIALAAGAATISNGWRYVCVYEDVDANGNWTISGLSSPSASTGPLAAKQVTVTTQPLTISSRISAFPRNVRIAVYRTLDGGVAPYYRLTTLVNDTTSATVSFTDSTADTLISGNAVLYSQPGVPGAAQDRRAPAGLNAIVSYNGMLVGSTGSDIFYSGQNVSGEGTWFNPVFQVPIPGDGDITALAVMDGTLFVFKRHDVYAIAGEPPSDNASQGGLGSPRRIASDLGAISSVTCTTAYGIIFQSDRGIEVLSRAQSVEWLGQGVQDTVIAFPIITAMTVDPGSSVVLIECAASRANGVVTGIGKTIVYDLSQKIWVSYDVRIGASGTVGVPAQSGALIFTTANGVPEYRYTWIASDGRVYVESNGYLAANGGYIAQQFETAWLKHGLQQEQKVWGGTILYQQYSASGLKIECAYDYAPYSSANDKVWSEAEVLTHRQLEFRPIMRGQAMKFRVTTTAPAVLGTGQGLTLIGMSFDMAQKQGSTKGTARLDTSVRK